MITSQAINRATETPPTITWLNDVRDFISWLAPTLTEKYTLNGDWRMLRLRKVEDGRIMVKYKINLRDEVEYPFSGGIPLTFSWTPSRLVMVLVPLRF